MKNYLYLLVLLFIIFAWHCSDSTSPSSKETESIKTPEHISPLSEVDKKIILKINNRPFTNKNLIDFIKNHYSDLDSLENPNKLRSRIFDFFIEQKMILYKVEEDNINLDQVEIDEYIQKMETPDSDNKKFFKESIKIQKYIYFKVYNDITVTEKEIRDYYNSNRTEFQKPSEVLLYQILVKNKEKATEIRGMLKNSPQKFSEIARNESESADAKNDGLMGYFEKGILPTEMENVVFSLKINEISPIVESPYGFHIFKVTRKRSQRLLFYSAVREEIKKNLLSEKLKIAYEDYLKQLKKELRINIHYQNLFFPYQSNTGDQNHET